MTDVENQSLGKYELRRRIGAGNMGTVYLARDPFALQDVAIKVAKTSDHDDSRRERRRRKLFFNEAKAAALLKHPNIVSTIDAGIEAERRYIVMEYVPGARTLADYCKPGNLYSVDQALSIILKCALALDYAHQNGVIHRDIKPKNILLNHEQEVKIADFGVALITRDDLEQTQVMGTLGSPRYMSPEQLKDEPVTAASDIFALGVVAYELLTGVHPFLAANIPQTARRIIRDAHTPIRELRPAVNPELARIIDRTLKKHPAGRYQTAMDLAGDLSLVYDEMKFNDQQLSGTSMFHRVRKLSFFESFEDSEVLEVINAGEWQKFEPGQEIISEGEIGDAFYVLISGEVSVRRSNVEVDRLRPGASFGEIGFIIRQERTASIVARKRATVTKVQASLIERTSLSCQLRFQKAFLRTMAERFSKAMDLIGRAAESGAGKG